jgi:nitric oxide reductase NorD protein
VAESRSWLESRHLTRSPEGRRALAQFSKLPQTTGSVVLRVADDFAHASVTLAHRFFIAAMDLISLRPDRYAWWSELLSRSLHVESGGRGLAQALLEFDALAVAAIESPSADVWRRAIWRLAESSSRQATAYARGVGVALLESAPTTLRPREAVEVWASAVSAVADSGGWRGDLLASYVAESAASLFAVFDTDAVESWAELVLRTGSAGRSPRPAAYPTSARSLGSDLHAPLLRSALAIAVRQPQRAESFLSVLCEAVAALPDSATRPMLAAIARTEPSEESISAIALLPAVTRGLNDSEIAVATASATRIAEKMPAALPAFLRKMGRAFEEGGIRGFEAWVERGLEVGAASLPAGLAHFRLETRTAHKLLSEHTAAANFEELEGTIQRYLRMIAKRPLWATVGPGLWLLPPIESGDVDTVRLPERVDLFRTVEDNQTFYLLSATHAAARWQYGTFDFRRGEYREHHPAPRREGANGERDGLIAFLESFPNPLLAVGLFAILDGIRIEARLACDFPGLRADLERIGSAYAASHAHAAAERLPEDLIEALFLCGVGRVSPDRLPLRLQKLRSLVETVRDRLAASSATVYDSTHLTETLYWGLSQAYLHSTDDPDLIESMIELGGATVVDPLEHLTGDSTPAQPTAESSPTSAVGPEDPAVQRIKVELSRDEKAAAEGGVPLSPEELRDLIERGVDIRITPASGADVPSLGLYITDLLGKLPHEAREELEKAVAAGDSAAARTWLSSQRGARCFTYDEWDYTVRDYRRAWCRLREVELEGDGGVFFGETLSRCRDLADSIRREFRMMRPEQFRKVRGMQHGDDFDLNAVVDAHADRRGRKNPSERLYVARMREERDVATLFLVDMSASTDEPLLSSSPVADGAAPRRVIDVAKETLALMAFVLDDIGDAYAIYGFSGHGRANVEFYRAKAFAETLSIDVKSRLGGIAPRRSTRMGAALRHAATKIAGVAAKARHLILLSDGFPQDYDYGDDRTSNVYGLRDTMVALQELEAQGIRTFCITVDPAGHDYLGEMCPETRYAVIDDVEGLPLELPRIYRTVTRL